MGEPGTGERPEPPLPMLARKLLMERPMGTLRARIFSTTGLLLGLQVLGTTYGLASWWQVHESCARQRALGSGAIRT